MPFGPSNILKFIIFSVISLICLEESLSSMHIKTRQPFPIEEKVCPSTKTSALETL